MKNQKFRSIIALALTVILAFTVFIPILRVSATTNTLSKCYYFSDYGPSQVFYNTEINESFQDSRLYYYEGSAFRQNFVSGHTNGTYDYINNAYVIFEIRSIITTTMYNSSTSLLSHMIDFFAELKDRGCQIMFISSIHHVRMAEYYEDLLINVDVHVDIAIWDRFVLTALYNMWNASGEDVMNTTIILDSWLSAGFEEDGKGWFVSEYFLPFIRALYPNEDLVLNSDIRDFYNRKGIKIIYCRGDGEYYNPITGVSAYTDNNNVSDLYNFANNEHIFALGSSLSGNTSLQKWASDMNNLTLDYALENIQTYVYNINGYNLSEHTTVKVTPSNPDLTDIMLAFINNNTTELESFDNYSNGTSDITYNYIRGSHVNQSKTAWLMDFEIGNSNFPLGWCQVIMDPDDYDYYFG